MQEILFSAKRIDNDELVEGNLILSSDVDKEYEAIIIPTKDSGMYTENTDLGFEEWYKVDPLTVRQLK